MLEFYIVTLTPAALVLTIILLIRMRRALRDIREKARTDPPDWPREEDDCHPEDRLWRLAYRG